MSEPFLAQITMFGGNFAPRGWSLCDGQLLPISQNTALFSLLGTTNGGDGRTTFALPELRGRFPMHAGNGPGLSVRRLGQKGGSETHNLVANQLPAHSHPFTVPCNNGTGNADNPEGAYSAPTGEDVFADSTNAQMGAGKTGNIGANQAVNHIPPFLCVNFIIALQGVFPSRS